MSKPDLAPDFEGLLSILLERELKLLGLLLNDPGLALLRVRRPNHPAVLRYDTIAKYMAHHSLLRYPDEVDQVLQLGGAALDNMTIAASLSPKEVIESIDDREVLNQLRSRAADPDMFFDQMAAFTCWNLLRDRNITSRLLEKEGLPDILVTLDSGSEEWIECKRIRLGSQPSRLRKVIKKANDQIKAANPDGVGAVYVFIERPQYRTVFDDTLPEAIKHYLAEVDRELCSGHSRSVAAVIMCWDDHMVLGAPPDPTMHVVRRRSLFRVHGAPRRQLELPQNALELGRSVVLWVRGLAGAQSPSPLKPVQSAGLTVTQMFRQESELPGLVRSVHAIAAMQQPDGLARYDLGGITVILATRWIDAPKHPYMMLLIAVDRSVDTTEIYLGFRVYPNGRELTKTTHPLVVFEHILEKFGLTVEVGNEKGLFLPHVLVDLPDGGGGELVKAHAEAAQPVLVSAFVKVNQTVPPTADVSWAFSIDTGRYRAEVAKHRR